MSFSASVSVRLESLPTGAADPKSVLRYNFGNDVVDATLKAMRERDPAFRLPDGFFEGEVAGVPEIAASG